MDREEVDNGKNSADEREDDGVDNHVDGNSEVRVAVENLSRRLAEIVAETPSALDAIEWRDLERIIAEVFSGLGFEVVLTPGSKDFGKDVIVSFLTPEGVKSYLIEIKHWRSGKRVGHSVIVEFVHVIAREERCGGLLLATYGFANGAIEGLTEIDRETIGFGTSKKIVGLCRSYVKARGGTWCPPDMLGDVLYVDTY